MLSILLLLIGVGLLAGALYFFLAKPEEQRRRATGLAAGGLIALIGGGALFAVSLGKKVPVITPPPPVVTTPIEEPSPAKVEVAPAEQHQFPVSTGSPRERSPLAARLDGDPYTTLDTPVEFPEPPKNPDFEEEPQEPTYSTRDMEIIAGQLELISSKFAEQLERDKEEWNDEYYKPSRMWTNLEMDTELYTQKLRVMAQLRQGRGTGPVRRDLFLLSKKYTEMVRIYAHHIVTETELDEDGLRRVQREIDYLRRRLAHYDPEAGTYVP